jgi:hypothetical protein
MRERLHPLGTEHLANLFTERSIVAETGRNRSHTQQAKMQGHGDR